MMADLIATIVIAALGASLIISIWLYGIYGQLRRIADSMEGGGR